MSLPWLVVVYFVIGVVCAALGFERSDDHGPRAAVGALVTLLIWPLWAPFVLLQSDHDES